MTVVAVLPAVRAAIAAKIVAKGLTCYAYDTWDKGDVVTLGISTWELARADQGYGIMRVTIPVLVYQTFSGNGAKSIEHLETRMAKVVNALGADITLGGVCPSHEIVSEFDATLFRLPNGTAYAVARLDVALTPFSNVGS